MSSTAQFLWFFLAVAAVIAILAIVIFNKLVEYKNLVKNAFAQIDVQLHRRHDLIPNLVETCKGYLTHEKSTLENVTMARNQAVSCLQTLQQQGVNAKSLQALAGAENKLASALGQLQVTIEDYPELKADQTIAQLSEEIASTENRIAFARQAYNDEVMQYNTYKQSFPQLIFAKRLGHIEDASMLQLEANSVKKEAPSVKF